MSQPSRLVQRKPGLSPLWGEVQDIKASIPHQLIWNYKIPQVWVFEIYKSHQKMQANWALVRWFPGSTVPSVSSGSSRPLPRMCRFTKTMTKLRVEAEESLTATETLTNPHSANSHRGTELAENTFKEMDVSDAGLNCSSLPGAAERCPHPGPCYLKAHS